MPVALYDPETCSVAKKEWRELVSFWDVVLIHGRRCELGSNILNEHICLKEVGDNQPPLDNVGVMEGMISRRWAGANQNISGHRTLKKF